MAKVIVKNKFGEMIKTFSLPCDSAVASKFCAEFLDGEYVFYEKKTRARQGHKSALQ